MRVLILLALILLNPNVPPFMQPDPGLAVVVNANTPVEDISLRDLRNVFLGERQYWKSDLPVVLLVRAPVSRERDAVLRTIQMSELQFKQYWITRIFRAEAISGPKVIYSSTTANELVGAIPGAITVIAAKELKPGLKVLKVDGHLPGEPGYSIR